MQRRRATVETRLRIYLEDHLALASGGRRLVQRMRRQGRSISKPDDLERFDRELADEVGTVLRLLARLSGPGRLGRLKSVAAMGAELVGRAKLNGQLVGDSPLSEVLELEALLAGVEAKKRLWVVAGEAVERGWLPEVPVSRLTAQAGRQHDWLVANHAHAVKALASEHDGRDGGMEDR